MERVPDAAALGRWHRGGLHVAASERASAAGRGRQSKLTASCAPQACYLVCGTVSIPYSYKTAKSPNFHFSNTLYFFLSLLRTPLNSTSILKQN